MISFLKRLFAKKSVSVVTTDTPKTPAARSGSAMHRQFLSYDECPKVYYRFNGSAEYGPQKIDIAIGYTGTGENDFVEYRFEDELCWFPRGYFEQLWNSIPASAHSKKRLTNEGINFEETIPEPLARELLRNTQNQKTPTKSQLQRLAGYGVSIENVATRLDAATIIKQHEKAERLATEQLRLDEQRALDAPAVAAAQMQLEELKEQVRHLIPKWNPQSLDDYNALRMYINMVDEALDYANMFTLEELLGNPFTDPTKEDDYYLETVSDPSNEELTAFKASVFLAYVKAGGESFEHLRLLKKAFPSLKVSKL